MDRLLNLMIVAALVAIGFIFLIASAEAHWKHEHDITVENEVFIETVEVTEVTNVRSQIISPTTENYVKAIAGAMASGAHQFDYSTTDYQASIIGTWQVGGGHEDGFSIGIGKRFSDMDVLFHGSYTPIGSDDWVTFGGTFRF